VHLFQIILTKKINSKATQKVFLINFSNHECIFQSIDISWNNGIEMKKIAEISLVVLAHNFPLSSSSTNMFGTETKRKAWVIQTWLFGGCPTLSNLWKLPSKMTSFFTTFGYKNLLVITMSGKKKVLNDKTVAAMLNEALACGMSQHRRRRKLPP